MTLSKAAVQWIDNTSCANIVQMELRRVGLYFFKYDFGSSLVEFKIQFIYCTICVFYLSYMTSQYACMLCDDHRKYAFYNLMSGKY